MIHDHIKWPPPGRYILAVSGGADSMVLLDILFKAVQERGYQLIVAHFDHGLRPDSTADRQLVEAASRRYKLPFEYHEANLGQGSEAIARTVRHTWLEQTRRGHDAVAVITAHHQDDLLETSLLNLARGSGRRGLAPMLGTGILRPLLGVSRQQLRDYAALHNIAWREDPTNTDITNPRNFLRHKLLPHMSPDSHANYLRLIDHLNLLNTGIDQKLDQILNSAVNGTSSYVFPRQLIGGLSLTELEELLLTAAYRLQPGIELEQRAVQEVALFMKTAKPHKQRPLRDSLIVIAHGPNIELKALQLAIKPLI